MILSTEQGRQLEAEIDRTYQDTGDLKGAISLYDNALAEHARFLSSQGISHRGFLVGGTIPSLLLAKRAEQESLENLLQSGVPLGNIVLLEGANNSPVHGSPRDCPEISMSDLADMFLEKEIGRLLFGHVYTAAPGDPERIATVTGHPALTLPPCDTCRPRLMACTASWPDMPYTTLAHDGPAREDRTLRLILDVLEGTTPPPCSKAIKERQASYAGQVLVAALEGS